MSITIAQMSKAAAKGIRPAYDKSNIISLSPYHGYMGLYPQDGVFPGTAYIQDFSEGLFPE